MKFLCASFFLFLLNTSLYSQGFTSMKIKEGIEILENGKKVLFYQVQPKSANGKYARAGYVHPLYDLKGNVLTEDMPADHPYHRGIFWAWHQINLDNKNVADGWMSEHIHWRPVSTKTLKKENALELHSRMLWELELPGGTVKPIVNEKTIITIHKSTTKYRILDFDIHLIPLVDSLKLGGSDDEKGYGGFCIRLKLPGDLSFTSQGKKVVPADTPVYAGGWMNFNGSFAGSASPQSGVSVFAYPRATDTSYPWILRSSENRSMQNVPDPGRTPVALPREGLHLTYRIIVHNDKLSNDEIQKLYESYYQTKK